MSLRKDVFSTLFFQLFALAAGTATNVIVARTLGPEGKGLLSFFSYLLFIAVNLGALGLQASAIQQIGRKRFPPETVATVQVLLGLGAGIVCAILLAVFLPMYKTRMSLAPALFAPFLIVVILALLWLNLSGVLIGLGRIRQTNRIEAMIPAAWLAGAIVVLALLHAGSVAGVMAWMAAQAVAPLAAILWLRRVMSPRLQVDTECAKASLRFGLPAWFANLIWTLLLRSDGLMLAYLAGPADVGIYSVAVLLAELLWYPARALNLALTPRVASGTREEATGLSQQAVRVNIWCVAALALGMIVAGRFLIHLGFGTSFDRAHRPLLLLLPGVLLGSISSPLSLYFTQQRGRPMISAWIAAPALLLNVALNLRWIRAFGPSGAAASSSVAYGLVAILFVLRFRREPGFSWRSLLVLRGEDLTPLRRLLIHALDRPGGRTLLAGAATRWARRQTGADLGIFFDHGLWIHRVGEEYSAESERFCYTRGWLESHRRKQRSSAEFWFHTYRPGAGDVIVDVGAGDGTDAAVFSRAVGPQGRVLAIEAHPATFRLLQATCRWNRLDNVVPLNSAVMDRRCTVFLSDQDEHVANTVSFAPDAERLEEGVPGVPLDELCAEHQVTRIDLLKMNIEGAERFAIDGMPETIRRTRHVCIACHDFLGRPEAATRGLVTTFLREQGFELSFVDDDARDYVRDHVHGRAPWAAAAEPAPSDTGSRGHGPAGGHTRGAS